MGDVLILGKDDKSSFQVEEAVKVCGFRGKLTFDSKLARDWIAMRPFDAVLVDVTVPVEEQQEFAEFIWAKNPLAHLIVFDLRDNNGSQAGQFRLFGADYVYGQKGMAYLKRILEKIGTLKPVSKKDFNILVVEDLDSPRDIICFYLEGLGYSNLRGVSSAQDAIKELDANPGKYSCIITDVKMPEMSGRDLIEHVRMRTEYSKLPIIVLTAIGTVENLIDCMKAGASGFLVKPPKKEDIVRELSRAFRIVVGAQNARLVKPEDAESLREALVQRGIV